MAALIAEVRRAFALNGKQIPPEIFKISVTATWRISEAYG
jgi:hypothetical protein